MRWGEWAISIAGGILIVGMLILTIALPWLSERERERSPETLPNEATARAEPQPEIKTPPALTSVDAPLSLSALRQHCVEEVRGLRPPGKGRSACDQFADRSRSQLPAPKAVRPPPPAGPRPSQKAPPPRQATTRPRGPVVQVHECEGHRYGSIAYRNCRKAEWKRLKKRCFQLREDLNTQHGVRHKQAETWVGPVCEAYERYQIVK